MKIFYHGTDMDGKCAGAIAYFFYKNVNNTEAECIPINYNHNFPFDDICMNENVIIVDFSLQKEGEFEKLLDITKNIIWIDHHKTAIERHKDIGNRIKGLRNITKSGCELTWEYFYPGDKMPEIVKLLGDYDTWTFKYGDRTRFLQDGIRLFNTKPDDYNWIIWLADNASLGEVIAKGEICFDYRKNYYAGLIKAWSFFVDFEGYKCVACNAGSVSSQLFDSVEVDFDIMMPFVFDGKQWTVSLYTTKNIDVSEIAKKYGGGGHKQAAGFQCEYLPWISP